MLLIVLLSQIMVQISLLDPSLLRDLAQAFVIALILQPWVVRQF